VGEWDVAGLEYGYWDQSTEYLLAQYALAPLILVRGAQAEWTVVILNQEAFEDWQRANPGQFEITSLKHNVHLLHRKSAE
jgi:hypothetical protein